MYKKDYRLRVWRTQKIMDRGWWDMGTNVMREKITEMSAGNRKQCNTLRIFEEMKSKVDVKSIIRAVEFEC